MVRCVRWKKVHHCIRKAKHGKEWGGMLMGLDGVRARASGAHWETFGCRR